MGEDKVMKFLPMQNVRAPEAFDFTNPTSWKTWKTRFQRFMKISGSENREDADKIDMLLYSMGGKVEEVIKILNIDEKQYDVVLEALDGHFNPKKNVVYERFKFNMLEQKEGMSVSDFLGALTTQAETCEFGSLCEELIRDRLVVGLKDKKVSERMLLKAKLTLEEAVNMAQQAEIQAQETKVMWSREEEVIVNRMGKMQQGKVGNRKCWWCGKWETHNKEKCPASKEICHKCKRRGHFARCCRERKINCMDMEKDDFELEVDVETENFKKKVKFLVDTGADIVAIPEKMLKNTSNIFACSDIIRGPEGIPLDVVGFIWIQLCHKSSVYKGKAFVIKNLQVPILGKPAIIKMNILRLCNTYHVSEGEINVEKEFPNIFNSLGVFKDTFTIKLISNPVPYVQSSPRVVPLPLLDKVKEELNRLESLGVIVPVEEPTMFVSPIVVVPKGQNGVRICGDYTQVNKNIVRPIFPIHKVENTLGRLKEARIFSKIDATSGFFQIRLCDKSRKLTTILTPFGRYMYNRLPMGLNCAPEYFSMKFSNIFSDLEGVVIHVDDILLYSKDRVSHIKLLREVCNRLTKEGLTINKDKCEFMVEEVTYLGHVINSKGISLDPNRIESIVEFRVPSNKKELMQFLPDYGKAKGGL